MIVYAVLICNIVLLLLGQTVWKIGLDKLGGLRMDNLLHVLLSPYILSGIALYGLATVLWLWVLSRLPLSIAYPLQSLAFVFGIVIAYFVFHESVPLNRWIGAAIIVAGITVLNWK
jgi:drug/metabolite transporter (DMT)-like permease